jgi:hypothetical protein
MTPRPTTTSGGPEVTRDKEHRMPTTTSATTRHADEMRAWNDRVRRDYGRGIGPAARADMRRLAVEYAAELLERPVDWSDPGPTLHDHRHALRVLAAQLGRVDPPARPGPTGQDAINRAGLAEARKVLAARVRCAGSGEHVNADAVDGNMISACPSCWRLRRVEPVDDAGRWFAVAEHRTRP